ncbi:hypothetical protein JZU54_07635, partial [bacterium]|nr:hypothetical protein [bacterium]
MKILFDQGTPVPLRRFLASHEVVTAFDRGWGELQNGDLLRAAEADGFAAIITTDQKSSLSAAPAQPPTSDTCLADHGLAAHPPRR